MRIELTDTEATRQAAILGAVEGCYFLTAYWEPTDDEAGARPSTVTVTGLSLTGAVMEAGGDPRNAALPCRGVGFVRGANFVSR